MRDPCTYPEPHAGHQSWELWTLVPGDDEWHQLGGTIYDWLDRDELQFTLITDGLSMLCALKPYGFPGPPPDRRSGWTTKEFLALLLASPRRFERD